MRSVAFTFCLFGVLGCYALPPVLWRAGEATDQDVSASAQLHLPSLTSALSSAANALPIKPPTTSDLPKVPLKFPTHMPTLPVHPSAINGIPSPVAIFAVDPSKMIPGIKGPLPFNPVAIGSNFVRPIAKLPFVVADNAYEIPLHTWGSVKNIVDAALHLPKDEISAGQQAVDDFFSALSG